MPIWQLDGARGFHALSRQERWTVVAVVAVVLWLTDVRVLWLVGAVALYRDGQGPPGPGPRRPRSTPSSSWPARCPGSHAPCRKGCATIAIGAQAPRRADGASGDRAHALGHGRGGTSGSRLGGLSVVVALGSPRRRRRCAGGVVLAGGWTVRHGWAIYRLNRGVGGTVFHDAERPALVSAGRSPPRRPAGPDRHVREGRGDRDRGSPLLPTTPAWTRWRWRAPPSTTSAPATAGRAAAPSPSSWPARSTCPTRAPTRESSRKPRWRCCWRCMLSKREILELYLNRVYMGSGYYGMEAMSRAVFGKPAARLTLGEAALLAGIIRAPATYSPWNHLEAAKRRSHVVLARMREEGKITASQERAARAERIAVRPPPAVASARHGYAKELLRQQFRADPRRRQPARLDRAHDLRARGAGRGRSGGARRPEARGRQGARGRARRDGPGHGQPAGRGRRLQLRGHAVQPGDPQPATARLGVQAVRLRRGAGPRTVARVGRERPARRGRGRARGRVDAARSARQHARVADAACGAARIQQRRRRDGAAADRLGPGAAAGARRGREQPARRAVAGARQRRW